MQNKITRTFLYSIAFFIIFSAILLVALRICAPMMLSDNTKVESIASHMMQHPVTMESMAINWRGFLPVLTLRNVIIYDDQAHGPILKVQKLQIGFNLIGSLIHLKPKPEQIIATGASLILTIHENGNIHLHGKIYDENDNRQSSLYNNVSFHKEIIAWLITQDKLVLEDWQLTINLPKNKQATFTLKDLQLTNHNNKHLMHIHAYSHDTKRFVTANAELVGNNTDISDWRGIFDIKMDHIILPSWLQFLDDYGLYLVGGTTNFSMKGQMFNGKIDNLHSIFSSNKLSIHSKKTTRMQTIDNVEGHLFWKKRNKGWEVSVSHFGVTIDNHNWPINNFSFIVTHPGPNIVKREVLLNNLEIEELHRFFFMHHILPEKLLQFFHNIQIKGKLDDAKLIHLTTNGNKDSWAISANFSKVTTVPWGNVPGFNPLSGNFTIGEQYGLIHLTSDNVSTQFQHTQNPVMLQHLDGDLTWNKNNNLKFIAHRVSIENIHLNDLTAEIKNIYANDALITIDTTMRANLPLDWDLLYQGEFKDQFKLLKDIDLRGKINGRLSLKIPIYQPISNTTVEGEIDVNQGGFKMIGWDLSFKNINGKLFFNQDNVIANKITAQLFGEPANISINIHDGLHHTGQSNVDVTSIISNEILKNRFHVPFIRYVNGRTRYQAHLLLKHDNSEHHKLTVSSVLQGIDVNLPLPLAKNKTDRIQLSLDAQFGATDKDTEVTMRYGDRLNAKMIFDYNKNTLKKSTLWFGNKEAPTPINFGISVGGTLYHLDPYQWSAHFSPKIIDKEKRSSAGDLTDQINHIDLYINKLAIYEQMFNHVHLRLIKLTNRWNWLLKGSDIAGSISMIKKPGEKIIAQMQYLYIHPIIKQKTSATLHPHAIPSLDISVNDFRFNNIKFGHVMLNTQRIASGIKINAFNANSVNYIMNASGYWTTKSHPSHTELQGTITSNHITGFLKEFDILPSLNAERGSLSFHFVWPTAPYNLSLRTISGNAALNFYNGTLLNLGKNANNQLALGHIITLLSVRALPFRLFNNRHATNREGFNFNQFTATLAFHNGVANTNNAVMSGFIADINAKGEMNFSNKTTDLRITIKPHITASLPVITAIAAGPIVGAAVFAIEQIAGRAFDNIAATNYRITGPWQKPLVTKIK